MKPGKGSKDPGGTIPQSVKIHFVAGKQFIELKSAARLAGIHPVILEMGTRLLKSVDGEGGIFLLATPELLNKAGEIELAFRDGLKKVAKALGPGGLSVKSYRDAERIVFWYALGGPRLKRAA